MCTYFLFAPLLTYFPYIYFFINAFTSQLSHESTITEDLLFKLLIVLRKSHIVLIYSYKSEMFYFDSIIQRTYILTY